MSVTEDKEATPKPESDIRRSVATSNIDPALSGAISSPSDSGESARDRAEEAWIENIRVIEALRRIVAERLSRREYEDVKEDTEMGGMSETKTVPKVEASTGLYPTLRAEDD